MSVCVSVCVVCENVKNRNRMNRKRWEERIWKRGRWVEGHCWSWVYRLSYVTHMIHVRAQWDSYHAHVLVQQTHSHTQHTNTSNPQPTCSCLYILSLCLHHTLFMCGCHASYRAALKYLVKHWDRLYEPCSCQLLHYIQTNVQPPPKDLFEYPWCTCSLRPPHWTTCTHFRFLDSVMYKLCSLNLFRPAVPLDTWRNF